MRIWMTLRGVGPGKGSGLVRMLVKMFFSDQVKNCFRSLEIAPVSVASLQ